MQREYHRPVDSPKRRMLLQSLAAAVLGALDRTGAAQSMRPKEGKSVEELQKSWKTLLAEGADVATSTEPIERSKQEWRKLLTSEQYDVLRQEGTERAGTSPLDREKRPGVFACAGCGLPLFTSAMKFDSGTGWPSFFTYIPEALATRRDFKLILPRTEYHCAKCGGHHGHLFDDGPQPTGMRWCNNGVALRFIPV
jgi:peptide-methionine (R)-S-oxide reductase